MPHRINGVQLFLKPTPHASWNRGHSGLGGRRSATPQFDALRFLESRPLRRVDECHVMQPEIRLTLLNANYLSVPLFFFAYSKHAEVTVPSLDDWEKQWKKTPHGIVKPAVVQVDF